MNKKFSFDLTVQANALNCPNPEAWYTKAYISQPTVANYRVIPGVKNSTKVSTATFSPLLVAESCDFSSSASALSAITMSVCPVQAQVEVCKKTLEGTFYSQQMAAGSANWEVSDFVSHFFDTAALEIQQEISSIMWKGSTTNAAYTGATSYLKLCDGFEKLLGADADVVDVTLTAVTVANVIDNLSAVLIALPAAAKQNKANLRFYVASDVATAFQIAASKGNTINYVTQTLGFNFAGIQLIEEPSMTNGNIVLTNKDNLVYLLDGEGDAADLKIINLQDTTAQPLLRMAAYIKIGFGILNGSQIAYMH